MNRQVRNDNITRPERGGRSEEEDRDVSEKELIFPTVEHPIPSLPGLDTDYCATNTPEKTAS
jgi:hypothetical protein